VQRLARRRCRSAVYSMNGVLSCLLSNIACIGSFDALGAMPMVLRGHGRHRSYHGTNNYWKRLLIEPQMTWGQAGMIGCPGPKPILSLLATAMVRRMLTEYREHGTPAQWQKPKPSVRLSPRPQHRASSQASGPNPHVSPVSILVA
jgi:hypothetical protein